MIYPITLTVYMKTMSNKKEYKSMKDDERKAYMEVRLRNLKRRYARVKEHADLVEEAIELKADIDTLEKELNS